MLNGMNGRSDVQPSKIEWIVNPDGTRGFTWNPITGCKHGCPYCYARGVQRRFGKTDKARKFLPELHLDRLDQPVRRRKPTSIFVCSMADLFGSWVSEQWIRRVFGTIEEAERHRYVFLTKNPQRYWFMRREIERRSLSENCWFGATATNQETYDEAVYWLGRFKASIAPVNVFVSLEPLHGLIDISAPGKSLIDWIVVGRETGPSPSPCKREWVEKIEDDARGPDIPLFQKDSLGEMMGTLRRDLPYLTHEERMSGYVKQ